MVESAIMRFKRFKENTYKVKEKKLWQSKKKQSKIQNI